MSELEGVCHNGNASLHDAMVACAGVGARLCSAAELSADVAKGSGCSLDHQLVWSSTNCSIGSTLVVRGSADSGDRVCVPGASSPPTTAIPSPLYSVRCCAPNTPSLPPPPPAYASTDGTLITATDCNGPVVGTLHFGAALLGAIVPPFGGELAVQTCPALATAVTEGSRTDNGDANVTVACCSVPQGYSEAEGMIGKLRNEAQVHVHLSRASSSVAHLCAVQTKLAAAAAAMTAVAWGVVLGPPSKVVSDLHCGGGSGTAAGGGSGSGAVVNDAPDMVGWATRPPAAAEWPAPAVVVRPGSGLPLVGVQPSQLAIGGLYSGSLLLPARSAGLLTAHSSLDHMSAAHPLGATLFQSNTMPSMQIELQVSHMSTSARWRIAVRNT
jgi:hypothetical protein